MNKNSIRFEARARILKAMAHPVRLLIIEELSRGEKCVCELTDIAGLDISTVSRHLSVLKNAGIAADSKRGLNVYYSLQCPCVLNFFGCLESVLQANARIQQDLVTEL
jgi:DNA-binding transcriptional ArsR family regulator